jgi:hypothetical protein
MSLYISVNYLISAILNYVSKNFGQLYHEKDVKFLDKEQLKQILKHKYLNVSCEEEVVYFICQWVTQRQESLREGSGA